MQEEWVGFAILQMNCKEVEKDFRAGLKFPLSGLIAAAEERTFPPHEVALDLGGGFGGTLWMRNGADAYADRARCAGGSGPSCSCWRSRRGHEPLAG